MKLLLEKDSYGTISVRENSHRSPGMMAHQMMVGCAPQNEYRVATNPHYCADEIALVWEAAIALPASMFGPLADREELIAWAKLNFCNQTRKAKQ